MVTRSPKAGTRLERGLNFHTLFNISSVADLGRDHVFSAALFSGPIKHQTEESGPQGARKTSETLQLKHYKLKNIILDMSKIFAAV